MNFPGVQASQEPVRRALSQIKATLRRRPMLSP